MRDGATDRVLRPVTNHTSRHASDEERHRHLRAVFRRHKPDLVEHTPGKLAVDQRQQAEQQRIVRDEFARLYGRPPAPGELEHILVNVWIEERELKGWRYDLTSQAWLYPDGTPVRYD